MRGVTVCAVGGCGGVGVIKGSGGGRGRCVGGGPEMRCEQPWGWGGGVGNVMRSPMGTRDELGGGSETPERGGEGERPPPPPPMQPNPLPPFPSQPGPPAASPPEPGEGIPRLSPPPRRLDGAGPLPGRGGRAGSQEAAGRGGGGQVGAAWNPLGRERAHVWTAQVCAHTPTGTESNARGRGCAHTWAPP